MRLKTKSGVFITFTGNRVKFNLLLNLSLSEFKEIYQVALSLPNGAETIILDEVLITKKDDDTIVFGIDDFSSVRTFIEIHLGELAFIDKYTISHN